MSKPKPDPLRPKPGDVFTRAEVVEAVRKKGPEYGSKYAVAKLARLQDSQVGKVYRLDLSQPGRTREAESLRLFEALFGVKMEVVYRVRQKEKAK